MKNLLYVSFIREDSESIGFLKKVISQCKVFSNFYNTYLLLSKKDGAILYKVSNNKKIKIDFFEYKKIYNYRNNIDKLRKLRSYFRFLYFYNIIDLIQNKYNIHITYFRATIPFRPFIKSIKRGKKRQIINVLEYPTYPYEDEFKKTFGNIKYNLIWKKGLNRIENLVDLIVGISASNKKILNNEQNKVIIISNGIDIENIKIKSKVKMSDKKKVINLLSVAYINFWHGFDRIIKGMYEYYKNNPKIKVYYHCIGEGNELENIKKLVKDLNIENYVIFHGIKTGKELDELFDIADIGIGSLGNHRKGIYFESALKNREYCARGLPFILSSKDTDFPDTIKFVRYIPNNDEPVNINEVINFYKEIKNMNYIEEMRKYAEDNLSWEVKMKPVIEKINNILERRN